MNRMALLSSLAVALLTLAAFVNHVQTQPLPGEVPPAVPRGALSAVPAAAGAASRPSADVAAPTTLSSATLSSTTLPPALRAKLEQRISKEIVAPLQLSVIDHRRFSRMLLPRRNISFRLEERTIRPPKECGPEFAQFRLEDSSRRLSGQARFRVLAYGRVHLASGRIEMAAGVLQPADDAWEPAIKTLRRLGLRAR